MNGQPTAPEQTNRNAELLSDFAHWAGYEGESPTSIAAIVQAKRLPVHAALGRAHELGLLSDTMSSWAVDSLRALLEQARQLSEPRDKSFHQLAVESAEDVAGEQVLAHWQDLEILYGIDATTSPASLDQARQDARGTGQFVPVVSSGAVLYESQSWGSWGYRHTW